MNLLRDVVSAWMVALGFWRPFFLIHLSVRLLAAAVIAPLAGLALATALAAAGQSVVTDQDIARFLLTPVGFAGFLALVSLLILASVLDVALMIATLRQRETRAMPAVLSGLGLFLRRFSGLLAFGAALVLRILAIAAPFVIVGGLVAWFALGRYDINYYLTYRPPAFMAAAAAGGVLLVWLAALLLTRLSRWAIALHLLLFTAKRS